MNWQISKSIWLSGKEIQVISNLKNLEFGRSEVRSYKKSSKLKIKGK